MSNTKVFMKAKNDVKNRVRNVVTLSLKWQQLKLSVFKTINGSQLQINLTSKTVITMMKPQVDINWF